MTLKGRAVLTLTAHKRRMSHVLSVVAEHDMIARKTR